MALHLLAGHVLLADASVIVSVRDLYLWPASFLHAATQHTFCNNSAGALSGGFCIIIIVIIVIIILVIIVIIVIILVLNIWVLFLCVGGGGLGHTI